MTNNETCSDPSIDYVYVVPDSQFFTNLDMIINYVQLTPVNDKMIKDLIIGLKNTQKNGYKLVKEND